MEEKKGGNCMTICISEMTTVNRELEVLLNISEDDRVKFDLKYKNLPDEMKMSVRESVQTISMDVQYGDIWYVNLGFNIGSEMDKPRPCIVASKDGDFNKRSKVVTVVPITTSNAMFSTQFVVNDANVQAPQGERTCKPINGIAKAEQLKTVSKGRFYYRMGRLTDEGIESLKTAIQNHLI